MAEEKDYGRLIQIIAGILAFVGIVGLYLNINSAIGMFFDYRKATLIRIILDAGLIITAVFLLGKIKR
ncbi:hypothetical protein [Geoglobus acetivorans]|uniref:DUF378 domain-containing protein n=1 Tax=Geoglobus acetivorans TaxID=565033 RepID=A0ABZ3H4P5_GEOAI|nr:hypothetical protein [Geoglobus acetivorans]